MADGNVRIGERWLAQRRKLHADYLSVAGDVDISHLAYLGRRRERFSEEQVAGFWAEQASFDYAMPPANHLYIHVPFCKSICSFCNYDRLKPGNADNMQRWLDRVVRSMQIIGPSTSGLLFHNLYLGGGTPSMLTADMLEALFMAVDANFGFHEQATRHFEFDPAAMNPAKVEVLSRFGFVRYSFGIQTLSAEVNYDHERGRQDRALVEKRLGELAPVAHSVNCDILLGLAGTTPEQMMREIGELLRLPDAPDAVDVFTLVPTQRYLDSHFGGSREAFEAHIAPFREAADAELTAVANAAGYSCSGSSAHCYRLGRLQPRGGGVPSYVKVPGYTQYTHLQGAPVNLLGLGTSARSHLFGRAQFEYTDPEGDVLREGPGHFEGREMTLEDEARVLAIMRMRDTRRVDHGEFKRIFGSSFEDLLPRELEVWRHQGLVEEDETGIRLIPTSPDEMLRALIWVVPSEGLEDETARHLGMDLSAGRLALMSKLPEGSAIAGHVVHHKGGATRFVGPSGELRVRWAPVKAEPNRVEARVTSTFRSAPDPMLLKAVRALERRLSREVVRGGPQPRRRQLQVV